MDPGSYCRDVESYLCRRNHGHLIRIVGPAFDLVCGWGARRIPLSVVFKGIDRAVQRRDAKGTQRRPARVEFCESDVLELFDEWRRAVGLGSDSGGLTPLGPVRRLSLVAHVERVITGLSNWSRSAACPPELVELVSQIANRLYGLKSAAQTARGKIREEMLAQLIEFENELMKASWETVDDTLEITLRVEAERELEPFRNRMPPAAFQQSVRAGRDRLLRERLKLPRIARD
jgi:hypothetical protein